MSGTSYRDLIVWQRAMDLVVHVFKLTESFPTTQRFGLTQQLHRAVISVPSNIAEGQARPSPREFRQFLGFAKGSLAEMETQVLLAQRLKFVSTDQTAEVMREASEVGRLFNGLARSLANPRTPKN